MAHLQSYRQRLAARASAALQKHHFLYVIAGHKVDFVVPVVLAMRAWIVICCPMLISAISA